MSSYWLSVNGTALTNSGYGLEIPDPYNPLHLPPYTIRLKYITGRRPTQGNSQTLVDPELNIWDVRNGSRDWYRLFMDDTGIQEVLGANTTGVWGMLSLFAGCTSLTAVTNVFDTSVVREMARMFWECTSLTAVPLFNTERTETMQDMFFGCVNVETGALALYQQASTQANPPTNHKWCFTDCGRNTSSGAAELAQIPSGWK